MGLHFTRMSDEALARIARSAAKYLEPGEKVRVVVWAQNTPQRSASLLGWWLIYKRYGFVTLVATDVHIYVFKRGFFQSTRLRQLEARLPIAGTDISLNRLTGALTVGPRRFGISALVAQGDARRLVELASGRSR
jgi:hypothetical protein